MTKNFMGEPVGAVLNRVYSNMLNRNIYAKMYSLEKQNDELKNKISDLENELDYYKNKCNKSNDSCNSYYNCKSLSTTSLIFYL